MVPNTKRTVYRFSQFEVDPDEVELRKHGIRVKLQEQPFKLLEALLERPGALITREELHARLWPNDTFVNFDHGLNAAAARLRQALGDSARLPRFVESVPRRGYRFIAPVEVLSMQPVESAAPEREPAAIAEEDLRGLEPKRGGRVLKPLLIGGSALIVFAATIWWVQSRDRPQDARSFKFAMTPPDSTAFVEADPISLSPDGRFMAFVAADSSGETELWIRPLDEVAARQVEGTKGAAFPFWSPDSRTMAFFANGRLNRVDIAGGLPKIVCSAADGRGGTWNAENIIVFAPSLKSSLFQVPAGGGEPKALTALDASRQEISHRWPSFLPDGRHFLYVIRTALPEHSAIYLGSLSDGRNSLLIPTLSNAVYASDKRGGGFLFYAHDATLVARSFDARALKFTGSEFPIADVQIRALLEPLRADFSVSDTGVLVYRTRRGADRLTWFGRNGVRLRTIGEPGVHLNVALSPDEKEVAFGRLEPHTGRFDIWRANRESGLASRVTYGSADQFDPVWSADGRRIFYGSTNITYSSANPGTQAEIREATLDGQGDRLLWKSEDLKAPWSANGQFLLFHEIHSGRKMDTWALPLRDGSQPIPLLQSRSNQLFAVLSPDGKWLAYASDESGKWEVYGASFTPGAASNSKWMVSDGGGSHPEWSRDGKQLYYLAPDKRIMAVAVETARVRFSSGAPRALFQSDIVNDFRARFAVTSDGQQFLIPSEAGQAGAAVAMVIVNWMPVNK